MDAVNVVAVHDVHHYCEGVVLSALLGGVHPPHAVGQLHHQPRLTPDDGGVRNRSAGGVVRPVGVEPGVQFQPPGVGFVHPECQRVIERLRSFALLAGEVVRPGLQLTIVQRIGLRPHL